jgi:hypothetical protein
MSAEPPVRRTDQEGSANAGASPRRRRWGACVDDGAGRPRQDYVAPAVGDKPSLVKAGPTPAFVLARVFAADGARVAAYVRTGQRPRGRRDGPSLADAAVRRLGDGASRVVRRAAGVSWPAASTGASFRGKAGSADRSLTPLGDQRRCQLRKWRGPGLVSSGGSRPASVSAEYSAACRACERVPFP